MNEIIDRQKTKRELKKKKYILVQELCYIMNRHDKPKYHELTDIAIKRFRYVNYQLRQYPNIYFFAQTLYKNIKPIDMINFIRNILYIKIQTLPKEQAPSKQIAASYFPDKKQIQLYGDEDKKTLFHELLHVASSDDIYAMSGFKAIFKNNITDMGNGLTEGYTELLNRRLFNSEENAYIYLQRMAMLIEQFYENKKEMMSDYFNCNLPNLIQELLKHMSLEEAVDIIVDMDILLKNNMLNELDYIKQVNRIIRIYKRNHTKEETDKIKEMAYTKKLVR